VANIINKLFAEIDGQKLDSV